MNGNDILTAFNKKHYNLLWEKLPSAHCNYVVKTVEREKKIFLLFSTLFDYWTLLQCGGCGLYVLCTLYMYEKRDYKVYGEFFSHRFT